MDVGGAAVQRFDDTRQRQVVRGDEADGAAFDQPTDDGFGADQPVVLIGSAQNFIEQKEQRQLAFGQFDDLAQPRDLGVKARRARLQRV